MPYRSLGHRADWAAERRAALNAIKVERGCTDCGYNAHPAALAWDHLGDKSTAPKSRHAFLLGWAWERIMAEIAKCEVVCLNCHAIRTANRGYTGGAPAHRRMVEPSG